MLQTAMLVVAVANLGWFVATGSFSNLVVGLILGFIAANFGFRKYA